VLRPALEPSEQRGIINIWELRLSMLVQPAKIVSAAIFLMAVGFLGIFFWSSLCALNGHQVVVQSEAIAENY
jgi:hypothetical protein